MYVAALDYIREFKENPPLRRLFRKHTENAPFFKKKTREKRMHICQPNSKLMYYAAVKQSLFVYI